MKIAVDLRWLRRGLIDGIGRVTLELTPRLVAHAEHAFVLLHHEDWTRELGEAALPAAGNVTWQRVPYSVVTWRDFLLLPRDLRKLGIDAYFTYQYPTSPLHSGYAVQGWLHDLIPFFYRATLRNKRRVWRLFYASKLPTSIVLRTFDRLQVPSQHTADDVARLFPAAAAKVQVVPYGRATPLELTDAQIAEELGALGLEPGYVLYVGRFEAYKNVEALVAAHRALPEELRRVHPLVLVGKRTPEIDAAIAGDAHVVGTGGLMGRQLEAAYRGAAVHAHPSLYEGFGLPPLEAMQRRVAVVTTDRASLPEVVGDTALLTDGSVEAMRAALERVLGDDELRERLAAAGLARTEQFSWERAAAAIVRSLEGR